ncbi:MAG: hypothetical protein M1833_000469 [Piccolia ochrophora]|nr:MAG: hypothetical protein M1833_000469 [Piccolia ochrophora]
MTRPQIIRADTIDLQDQDAPSAKDHSRQPTHPNRLGGGSPAPHQARTLKAAENVSAEEQQTSPRVSWVNGDNTQPNTQEIENGIKSLSNGSAGNTHVQDEVVVKRNGSLNSSSGEDEDMADAEGDDGLDDDMMDKISSSPSIDDGGYHLPQPWPARVDSISPSPKSPSLHSSSASESQSSSPYTSTPVRFPLASQRKEGDSLSIGNHHHLQGRCLGAEQRIQEQVCNQLDVPGNTKTGEPTMHLETRTFQDYFDAEDLQNSFDGDADTNLSELLLPVDDPLLEDSFDDTEFASLSHPLMSDTPRIEESEDDSEDDDDADDFSFDEDDIYLTDTGWGGECLRELEDIDFEFVYALHTFVATVEGQANATKGDTMVLLDDSNSYWWLVRVVKDSSIGYLPAEHIETPTERLARLNKHRNIDLSQTMLGDNPEKSKNPLKKAMRRRNAKTVQFTAPTYVEASENEYSTEDGEHDGDVDGHEEEAAEATAGSQVDQDEITPVEPAPLKIRAQSKDSKPDLEESAETARESSETDSRNSERNSSFDGATESQNASHKSRNGTVRNTDSFFKDDSVETRKITLTPNLLRDDSSPSSSRASERDKELKSRGSLESMEKATPTSEKGKEDKKRKEKKGMLSGLFKRKDRKSRAPEDDADDVAKDEKQSGESSRGSPILKTSEESATSEHRASPQLTTQVQTQPQRQPSKLQKPAPTDLSPSKDPQPVKSTENANKTAPQSQAPDGSTSSASSITAGMRPTDKEIDHTDRDTPEPLRVRTPEHGRKGRTPTPDQRKESKENGNKMFPITNMLKSSTGSKSSVTSNDSRPEKVKKAKKRVELDDFDSSPEEDHSPTNAAQTTTTIQATKEREERLSESPVQVSPVEAPTPHPPGLFVDSSSQETPASPVSPASSPEMVDAPEIHTRVTEEDATGDGMTAMSSNAGTPTWSDASLRTYLEDDNDIRDLLVVVHDKSGVAPAGPEHPIVGGLFKEENAKLAEITTRLDGMLNDWLARKARNPAR